MKRYHWVRARLREPEEAACFVQQALRVFPERVAHVWEIARRVRVSVEALNASGWMPPIDAALAESAALLHDIGYWEPIALADFHPLDGMNFLLAKGEEELARIIVGVSCSPEEGALRGFPGIEPDPSVIAKLVTFWDLHVKQGGEVVCFQERLDDIFNRYPEGSIVREANLRAKHRLEQLVSELSPVLTAAGVVLPQAPAALREGGFSTDRL